MFDSEPLQREPPRRIEEAGKGVGMVNSDGEPMAGENVPGEAAEEAREKVGVRGVAGASSFLSPNASLKVFGSALAFLLWPVITRTVAVQARFMSVSAVAVNADIVVRTAGHAVRTASLCWSCSGVECGTRFAWL